MSPLRSHKRRHNFSDTPFETCVCNLGIEDNRHFFKFKFPFYAIQRVPLVVSVIDTLQRKNLNHLENHPELYLCGHPHLLISLIIDNFSYQQLQLRKINALSHPIPTLLQSDLITLFVVLVFVIFCKFLGCHGFGLFRCQGDLLAYLF